MEPRLGLARLGLGSSSRFNSNSRELKGTRGNSRELEGTRGNSSELEGTHGNSRELKEALVEVMGGKKPRKRGKEVKFHKR